MDFSVGPAMLCAVLVHPMTLKPAVRFAVEDADAEGGVPLDKMTFE